MWLFALILHEERIWRKEHWLIFLQESDFVALHARLVSEMHQVIGSLEFGNVKPTATFQGLSRC